jgi:LysR family transcriptional activator of nhaA
VLSEAGRVALGYADQIFQLGEALIEAVQHSDSESTLRLRAGISDGIPKLLAYRLLSTVTSMPADVRLICDEGEFETLLADLALHRLDVVLTDRPAPAAAISRCSAPARRIRHRRCSPPRRWPRATAPLSK